MPFDPSTAKPLADSGQPAGFDPATATLAEDDAPAQNNYLPFEGSHKNTLSAMANISGDDVARVGKDLIAEPLQTAANLGTGIYKDLLTPTHQLMQKIKAQKEGREYKAPGIDVYKALGIEDKPFYTPEGALQTAPMFTPIGTPAGSKVRAKAIEVVEKYIPQLVGAAKDHAVHAILRSPYSPEQLSMSLEAAKGTKAGLGQVIGNPILKHFQENILSKVPLGGAQTTMQSVGQNILDRAQNLVEKHAQDIPLGGVGDALLEDLQEASVRVSKEKTERYKGMDAIARSIGLNTNLKGFKSALRRSIGAIKGKSLLDSEPEYAALLNRLSGMGDLAVESGGGATHIRPKGQVVNPATGEPIFTSKDAPIDRQPFTASGEGGPKIDPATGRAVEKETSEGVNFPGFATKSPGGQRVDPATGELIHGERKRSEYPTIDITGKPIESPVPSVSSPQNINRGGGAMVDPATGRPITQSALSPVAQHGYHIRRGGGHLADPITGAPVTQKIQHPLLSAGQRVVGSKSSLTSPITGKRLEKPVSLSEANILSAKLRDTGHKYMASNSPTDHFIGGVFKQLAKSLKNDVKSTVHNSGHQPLIDAFTGSESFYSDEFSDFLNKQIRKYTHGEGKAEDLLDTFLKTGGNKDRAEHLGKFFNLLSPRGKGLARYGYLGNAYRGPENLRHVDPKNLATLWTKLGENQKKLLFPDAKYRREIDGFVHFTRENSASLELMYNPKTGQVATSMLTAYMAMHPAASIPAVLKSNILNRILTSEKTRNKIIASLQRVKQKK